MLHARWTYTSLRFRFPAGTSRGVLNDKPSWFLLVSHNDDPGTVGIGEVSLIPGLSPETPSDIPHILDKLCVAINEVAAWKLQHQQQFPAVHFALETALADLQNGGKRLLAETAFTSGTHGIPINGLVWMGTHDEMLQRVEAKLQEGFRVLKLKVGAIGFEKEMDLLRYIRLQYSPAELEIRLDANGAFGRKDVFDKLEQLAAFHIHSIEQPVAAGNPELMRDVCAQSPVKVALDEELIGMKTHAEKEQLVDFIRPSYLILKPSLVGGLAHSDDYARIAEARGMGWWATSALESNIGLNAIAQWSATRAQSLPQGLGTGQLFHNNIPSPLTVRNGRLWYETQQPWNIQAIIQPR